MDKMDFIHKCKAQTHCDRDSHQFDDQDLDDLKDLKRKEMFPSDSD